MKVIKNNFSINYINILMWLCIAYLSISNLKAGGRDLLFMLDILGSYIMLKSQENKIAAKAYLNP